MVFAALTAVVGIVIAGIVAAAAYVGVVDLARDAARAAALDPVNATSAAEAVVAAASSASSKTSVSVDTGEVITVTVTQGKWLFDLAATAVIVAEPLKAEL